MTKKFEKVPKNRDKMNALKLKNHCFSLGKTYFSRNSAFPKMYPKINKKTSKIHPKKDQKKRCQNDMQKCDEF